MSRTELPYPIVMREVDTGEGVQYEVTVPDLPGCVAAGESPEEALSEIGTFMREWLEEADLIGVTPKARKAYSGRFTVRTSQSTHQALDERAAIEGVSLSHLVTEILGEFVGRRWTNDLGFAPYGSRLGAPNEATLEYLLDSVAQVSLGQKLQVAPLASQELDRVAALIGLNDGSQRASA